MVEQALEEKLVRARKGLEDYGYIEVSDHNGLKAGVRGRHSGDQYTGAYTTGTATILHVFARGGRTETEYGKRPDIEILVHHNRFSEPTIGTWANYHFYTVEPSEAADTTHG